MFPRGYNIFRKDLKLGVKKSGVFLKILVRKEYTGREIKLDTESNLELVFVDLKLKHQQTVKIGSYYWPPWADDSYMEEFAQTLG